ncbi:MAG: hypothetical protein NTW19_12560 [Planctomycetota bacterium]|nr:hypothetical protein [Planctomycetota bacterium]
MVFTLLAIVLLACLIVYVINTGVQTRNRLSAQHAADAAAMDGAAWVARSLNTVAMNNVAMTRYLALVNVLDALPIATTNSLQEGRTMEAGLTQALNATTGTASLDNLATSKTQVLLNEIRRENGMLANLNNTLLALNIEDLTHFTVGGTPGARGKFWTAMRSLDEMSQASIESIGDVAGSGAAEAVVNLHANDRTFLLPAAPLIPWRRGTFADFRRPVLQGILPNSIDDRQFNRGPYDTIYGWRERNYTAIPDTSPPIYVEEVGGVNTGGAPDPFGGGPANRGHWVHPPTQLIPTGYHVYGTLDWTLKKILHFNSWRFGWYCRFNSWLDNITRVKCDYGWNGLSERFFAQVNWDPTYPQDVPVSLNERLPFSETLSIVFAIKSLYPRGDSRFLTPGTWAPPRSPNDGSIDEIVRIRRQAGWWLPNMPLQNPTHRTLNPLEIVPPPGGTMRQLNDASGTPELAWLYEFPYTVTHDEDLGINRQVDGLGNAVPQPAYSIQMAFYVAVNRNRVPPGVTTQPQSDLDVSISNPYDGLDLTEAPAPIDLDHALLPPNNANARWKYLSFMGVARAANNAPVLPQRFTVRRPMQETVTIAQAKVFNNHSWDLWTQMWHAQLEPVSNYQGWIDTVSQAADPNAASGAPADPELTDFRDYLQSLNGLAPLMLHH